MRPEGEPTPLGTDQGQADVGSIPLPPGVPPPPRRRVHQLHCRSLRHRLRRQHRGRPRRRRPQGVNLRERERQVPPKTRDMLLQVSQTEETGMTAPHLMVTERTVVMERKVVTERTVVMERKEVTERTVVTEKVVGVRTAQTAMTMTVTMRMKSPNTVVWGHAARRPAKERMPPPKNRHPRQRSHHERKPRRRGPHHPNHLPREQTRGRGRRPAVSSLDSSRMEPSIPVLV